VLPILGFLTVLGCRALSFLCNRIILLVGFSWAQELPNEDQEDWHQNVGQYEDWVLN
jgi:hypothetical protein